MADTKPALSLKNKNRYRQTKDWAFYNIVSCSAALFLIILTAFAEIPQLFSETKTTRFRRDNAIEFGASVGCACLCARSDSVVASSGLSAFRPGEALRGNVASWKSQFQQPSIKRQPEETGGNNDPFQLPQDNIIPCKYLQSGEP